MDCRPRLHYCFPTMRFWHGIFSQFCVAHMGCPYVCLSPWTSSFAWFLKKCFAAIAVRHLWQKRIVFGVSLNNRTPKQTQCVVFQLPCDLGSQIAKCEWSLSASFLDSNQKGYRLGLCWKQESKMLLLEWNISTVKSNYPFLIIRIMHTWLVGCFLIHGKGS